MSSKKVNSIHTPIYREAGFYLKDIETTKKAFADEVNPPHEPDNYIYSRYRNPSVVSVEKELMELEGSKWALATQSGMAAIDLALSIFQKADNNGKWLFFSEIYGGTNSFIETVLKKRRGLDIEHFYSKDGEYDLQELEEMLDALKPELIYFEAVSNPFVIVADVMAIIKIAKDRDIKIIIDNTFATPYLWKPLEDGADLVIHSATKYLGGHGNLTAGVVCGNDIDLMTEAIEYRKWVGHMLSPDDCYRLETQLKTFDLRIKKHCDNALELAKLLEKHPNVEKVHYPGLESHSTHNTAKELFKGKGYGGVITFDLAGDTNEEKAVACEKFITATQETIPLVTTLGEADSILLPVEAVWGQKYPYPGMIRLSVGIENYPKLESIFLNVLDSL